MFFRKPDGLAAVSFTQFRFKLQNSASNLLGLAVVQCLAMPLTLGSGVTNFGTSYFSNINEKVLNGSIIEIFTLIWIGVIGFSLTTARSRSMAFTFVSSRLSAGISDGMLLISFGFLAAVSTPLCGLMLRLITYYTNTTLIVNAEFLLPFPELIRETAILLFYFVLAGAAGYLVGALLRYRAVLIALIPILLLSLFVKPLQGLIELNQ